MFKPLNTQFWIRAPFVRLLLPLLSGILVQWYYPLSHVVLVPLFIFFFFGLLIYHLLPITYRYKFSSVGGAAVFIALFLFGMLLLWHNDVKKDPAWYGHSLTPNNFISVNIAEPLIEKTNSIKADGNVVSILDSTGKSSAATIGKVILYFAKTPKAASLNYGDEIILSASLQKIKNIGNPGGFNYERYAAFQGLYHTVYLRDSDYVVTGLAIKDFFKEAIYNAREYIVNVLQRYVQGNKDAVAVAEALLIGYKHDLDKDLVQAYSNTGVVHIIAISGLHLGLIYLLLVWLFSKLPFIKNNRYLKTAFILVCLWGFALLTGASASVLRSAVMFSFIVLGKYFFRESSIYNSLAASAFLLLCYDPYLLWDVGFQLSYLAVLGIVWLQKPIHRLLWVPSIKKPEGRDFWLRPLNTLAYILNWLVREVWAMASITLAAQIATTPISLYYFHQFPNLFLPANIIAVPLSTIILYAEILLVVFSPVSAIATYIGKACYVLIAWLNHIILWFDKVPFSKIDWIFADVASTILLYILFILFAFAFINKSKRALYAAFSALFLFASLHLFYTAGVQHQRKMVVYNISKLRAIDFVSKNQYMFYGDSILLEDAAPRNFNLRPARISMQLLNERTSMPEILQQGQYCQWFDKKIMLIDTAMFFPPQAVKQKIDVVVISKNARLGMPYLAAAIDPEIIVFDASNSLWKIEQWKRECTALNLRHYSVTDSGAFVYNIARL